MKKIRLWQPVYKVKVKEHNFLKPLLLLLLVKAKAYSSKIDSISSLDWEDASDLKREWVQIFGPVWMDNIKEIADDIGCGDVCLEEMWFQQYSKNGSHGWHVHSGHYTGVYYLELDKTSPPTELRDPYTKKIHKMNVKEGDMIVFPSYIYHRAPINKSVKQKTIISWNFGIE
tara:strand:+ start:278 stop:793 length:516 start_codon:yes stop_codon:yes gene_type:complete